MSDNSDELIKNIIATEVAKLKLLKPRIRTTTGFGDSNTDAIQAQIDVLENGMSIDQVWDKWEDEDHIRDSALIAIEWLDNPEAGALAVDWQELVIE